MRVVVIGAYGVFGSRLLELLKRDGHDLWAAGRDRRWTEDCAARFGAQSLHVDLAVDLSPILAAAPQVVVDAAGPYQFYGSDPYKVARFCVDNGIHYLDLSDDADFTAGIGALDAQAIAAGCFVLSGASSVPGLSSAAVRALADGLDEIVLIETAILPGNRIPRGKAVMASILDQVGRRSKTWRGGMWRDTRCWTDRRRYRLMDGPVRGAWFIRVPDIQLFPRFFAARSVMFRAGMELPALNLGIATLALLRRWRLLPDGRRTPHRRAGWRACWSRSGPTAAAWSFMWSGTLLGPKATGRCGDAGSCWRTRDRDRSSPPSPFARCCATPTASAPAPAPAWPRPPWRRWKRPRPTCR